MRLSEINPCMTPDMERFLEVLARRARGYRITELNERLERRGGYFLNMCASEVADYLKENLQAEDVEITRTNKGYVISFFVGERNGKRKAGRICCVEFSEGG
jgi:hypothetical protein